jgi:hypothetical protein
MGDDRATVEHTVCHSGERALGTLCANLN